MTDTEQAPPDQTRVAPTWGRLEVHPGAGVVHRDGDTLLVVPVVDAAVRDAVVELLKCCALQPDPSGRRRIRCAAWLLTEAEPEQLPGFALAVQAGARLTVLAHGHVAVQVHQGEQDVVFRGTESLAWVERTVPAAYDWVRIEALPATDSAPGAESAAASVPGAESALDAGSTHRPTPAGTVPLDLVAGTVPGSGATLRRAEVTAGQRVPAARAGDREAPARANHESARVLQRPVFAPGASAPRSPAAAQPEPPRVEASTGHTVLRPRPELKRVALPRDRSADQGPARPPLPVGVADAETTAQPLVAVVMVEGVLCPSGHLNRPGSTSCALCGTPLDDTGERVVQARPPLGVLVTDAGAVYTLSGDYVIGRDPQQAPDVQAGRALPLPLRDAEHSTSRVHAHVRISGWDVLVSDGASANGTFVSRDGASGPWTPVPREPGTALQPGDRVKVGNRQLLFDRYQQPLSA